MDLFSHTKIFTIQNNKEVIYDVEFEGVELHLYPRGAALLVIDINWLPTWSKQGQLTVDDVRTLIYVSRYKHIMEGVCRGWGLGSRMQQVDVDMESAKCKLGSKIFQARYMGKTIGLSSIANWLLCLPGDSYDNPPLRTDISRHANHHSTVVISKEPSQTALNEYLFHMRRAFGQKNRPPPDSVSVLGRVLCWRMNKYIGISREGTVSMSWPIAQDDSTAFELTHWHKKFQGVYLILALHAHGEKLVFEELSNLAATQAEYLSLDANFEQVQRQRNSLRQLASVMTRYTLAMSSNDCGGSTEYSEFFTSLREVYGIPELREELSGELKDVLAVVESNYLEEERRQRFEQGERRRSRTEQQRKFDQLKDSHRQRFEIILSIFSSITIPFVIIGGIWGMNLQSLPDVDFWFLLAITSLISIVILVVLVTFLMCRAYRLNRANDTLLQQHPEA